MTIAKTHPRVGSDCTETIAGRIALVTEQLLAKNGLRFAPFINTHVNRLLTQGAKAIQQAYRTKAHTIAEHEVKLVKAQEAARHRPTRANIGLVGYYEKELERLRTEHQILRDAMGMTGIPVP